MMMSDYAVEYNTAQEITRLHTRAHDVLASMAETCPTDIDGGAGADLLLSILSPLATDAGSLCLVHASAAARMETTVDLYRGIEEDAEEAFEKMAEDI